MLKILWSRTLSQNKYSTTNALSVEIKRRRWRWIGHINRMALNAIPRVAEMDSFREEEKRTA